MTVECKNGDTYRGFLDETEDNMNCILKDATRKLARPAHAAQVLRTSSPVIRSTKKC